MTILVVEDSARLRRSLYEGLRRSGFVVDVAADGKEGLGFALANDYDVLVLDIMLPKLDGLEVLRQLRGRGRDFPVLILSAKDQVNDRVHGLDVGADDYLVKPFALDELCARIKALARRRYNSNSPEIRLGAITVDTAKRRALVDATILALTPAEYGVLELLALRRGRVVSKAQLWESLNSSDSETSSNVIEVLISSIRRKTRPFEGDKLIKTRRGYGYMIE